MNQAQLSAYRARLKQYADTATDAMLKAENQSDLDIALGKMVAFKMAIDAITHIFNEVS